MSFEGHEKKLEILLNHPKVSARKDPYLNWDQLLKMCQATILHSKSHQYVDEYILSESSLFVYDDQIILITCGQTLLYSLAVLLVQHWGKDEIDYVFYCRTNLWFPQNQLSDFEKEVESLMQIFPGKSYRFGPANKEHIHVFLASSDRTSKRKDTTVEVLMENIPQCFLDNFYFSDNSLSFALEKIRSMFSLEKFFKPFDISDHCFEPQGYSCNGILCDDNKYFTIHVTPEKDFSYISFETNVSLDSFAELVCHLTESFQPESFILAYFSNERSLSLSAPETYAKMEEHSAFTDDYLIQTFQFRRETCLV